MTDPSQAMDPTDPSRGSPLRSDGLGAKGPWAPQVRGEIIARGLGGTLFVLMTTLWLMLLVQSGGKKLRDQDWVLFQRVGQQLFEGDLRQIYRMDSQFPFLYPPYVIYACAPIGMLPDVPAYAACVTFEFVLLGVTLWTLWRLLPATPGEHLTILLVTLGSAPWLGVVITGHFTVLNVLFMTAGFLAWRDRKPLTAGAIISGLTIKPNLGVVYGFIALFHRQWKMLAGMFLGFFVLLASTLPLGIDVWRDYLALTKQLPEQVKAHPELFGRQQNLFAFWRTIFPSADWGTINVVWVASALVVGAAAAWNWRGPVTPDRLPRLLAVTVLGVVACNPYLFFYDALLLLIPAAVWFIERRDYQPRLHRAIGVLIALIYLWQHVSMWYATRGPALVGLAVGLWTLLETFDLASQRVVDGARPAARQAQLVAP